MAITKTDFINYSRCPRYASLNNIKKEKLKTLTTFKEYHKQQEEEKIKELINNMYDGDTDLIDIPNEYLEVMMPYYNEVELLTGQLMPKYFKGTFKYSKNTKEQESFDCLIDNIRYICYVDIYNEVDDAFNIIEVKATTSKKFLSLGATVNKKFVSIFTKDDKGIYRLDENSIPSSKYKIQKQKLFDRYSPCGHYVYDLAVQRYIIENDLLDNDEDEKIDKIKYYLAVLNHEYIFDGTYENGKPLYNLDENNNDIISFIDMTDITKEYMNQINIDRKNISNYIANLKGDETPLGKWCEYKKNTHCKYCDICFKKIPKENSIFTYFDNQHGFNVNGKKQTVFDLINQGYYNALDIKEEFLTREKNKIQRKVIETNIPYINNQKIIDGIKQIKYPIYHLDFETFPCPLPRYKGEKCYSQSVFQFSMHIEKERGQCDKDKDHYEYLAIDHLDHREAIVKKLCELIGDGTVLVYNDSFEKTRIKELAQIFPEYAFKLLKINSQIFDLMNIVKTKSNLYESLGYTKEEATLFNYYHKKLDGSFSIKKVLPLFSDLTYQGMEIGNGVEALITYARFNQMDQKEYTYKYQKLVEYCKQDTWAMVCVLWGLINSVK